MNKKFRAVRKAGLSAPPTDNGGILDDPAPKPIVEAVQPSKPEPARVGPEIGLTIQPGDLAAPDRKSVADVVDGRVLRSTGRVRPLQLALSDKTQNEFRCEAARRYREGEERYRLNDLFEDAWAAWKKLNKPPKSGESK